MFLFYLTNTNLLILSLVMRDFQRRNFVCDLLTQMLEVDLNRRSSLSVRMLSVNFCHPPSMLTWLEMRRMTLDIGKRFYFRILGDIACFVAVILFETLLLLLKAYGYLSFEPLMSFWHWMAVLYHVIVLGVFGIRSMFYAAYINENTRYQIEKLIMLRHLLHRLMRDERLLERDFNCISHDLKSALYYIDITA